MPNESNRSILEAPMTTTTPAVDESLRCIAGSITIATILGAAAAIEALVRW